MEISYCLRFLRLRERCPPRLEFFPLHIVRIVICVGRFGGDPFDERLVVIERRPGAHVDVEILKPCHSFRTRVDFESLAQRLISARDLSSIDLVDERANFEQLGKGFAITLRQVGDDGSNLDRSEAFDL